MTDVKAMEGISDALLIGYDGSEEDVAVMAIARRTTSKIDIIKVITGKEATDLYIKLTEGEKNEEEPKCNERF